MSAVALAAMGSDGASVRRWAVAGHTYCPDDGEVVGLGHAAALDKALQVGG